MATRFFDTSALLKRYVWERGTEWVRAALIPIPGRSVFVSMLTPAEVASALERRERQKALPTGTTATALRHLRTAIRRRELVLVRPSLAVVESAMELATKHSLKGADAFQLAHALHVASGRKDPNLAPVAIVSADDDLNTAAEAEGLAVENPNDYEQAP